MSSRNRMMVTGLLAVLLVAALACGPLSNVVVGSVDVGELVTENQTVPADDLDSAEVRLLMGAGELGVFGGADDLMEAEFTYNVEDWQPEVTFDQSGGQGDLTVEQPDVEGLLGTGVNDIRYEWDIRLSEDVPLDLRINVGAGRGTLDLSDLTLDRVDVSTGAGEVDINLAGTSVPDLKVSTGAGDASLDLSGAWENDLDATISTGAGRAEIRLPADVGVRVDVDAGIANVTANGFNKSGSIYTNDAYDDADVRLDLHVNAGLGEVDLELVE